MTNQYLKLFSVCSPNHFKCPFPWFLTQQEILNSSVMEMAKHNVEIHVLVKSAFSGHTRTKDKIMSIRQMFMQSFWSEFKISFAQAKMQYHLKEVIQKCSLRNKQHSTFSSGWSRETACKPWITSQWIEIFLWLVKPESNSHLLTAWWMTSVLTYAECPKGRVLSMPSTTWDGGHCTVNSWGPLFSACLGEH